MHSGRLRAVHLEQGLRPGFSRTQSQAVRVQQASAPLTWGPRNCLEEGS